MPRQLGVDRQRGEQRPKPYLWVAFPGLTGSCRLRRDAKPAGGGRAQSPARLSSAPLSAGPPTPSDAQSRCATEHRATTCGELRGNIPKGEVPVTTAYVGSEPTGVFLVAQRTRMAVQADGMGSSLQGAVLR